MTSCAARLAAPLAAARLAVPLCAALLALVAMAAPPAHAHAELLGAEPEDGATVADPPEVIRLEFDEPVDPRAIAVTGPDGAGLAVDEPRADGAVVTQAVHQPAATGAHTVSWRVVSADGHRQDGELGFTYTGPTADAPPAVDGEPGAEGARWPLVALAGAGLAVGLLAVLAWRRLGSRPPAGGRR